MTTLKLESSLIQDLFPIISKRTLFRYNDKRKSNRRLAFKSFDGEAIDTLLEKVENVGVKGWEVRVGFTCYGPIYSIVKFFPL